MTTVQIGVVSHNTRLGYGSCVVNGLYVPVVLTNKIRMPICPITSEDYKSLDFFHFS